MRNKKFLPLRGEKSPPHVETYSFLDTLLWHDSLKIAEPYQTVTSRFELGMKSHPNVFWQHVIAIMKLHTGGWIIFSAWRFVSHQGSSNARRFHRSRYCGICGTRGVMRTSSTTRRCKREWLFVWPTSLKPIKNTIHQCRLWDVPRTNA